MAYVAAGDTGPSARIGYLLERVLEDYGGEPLAEATTLNAAAYFAPTGFGVEPSRYLLVSGVGSTCPTP